MNLALPWLREMMRRSNSGPFLATKTAVFSTMARMSGGGWMIPMVRVWVATVAGGSAFAPGGGVGGAVCCCLLASPTAPPLPSGAGRVRMGLTMAAAMGIGVSAGR